MTSRTVCLTIIKTIEFDEDSCLASMSDEELIQEFQDSWDNYSLEDWCYDDESITIEVFDTKSIVLGGDN